MCRGWFAHESQGFAVAEVMESSTGEVSADGKVTWFFPGLVCTVPVGACCL